MDSGVAALVGSIGGAIVGTLGTLGTTWLSAHLNKKKPDAAEEAAKVLLRTLLNRPKWKWARIETLSNAVGSDEVTVRRLLLEIGARGSLIDGHVWGLLSRNPISDQADKEGSDAVFLELSPDLPSSPEDEPGGF
jgi:hypothetical protein